MSSHLGKGRLKAMASSPISRRGFITRLGGTTLGGALGAQLLAACANPATPAAAPTSPPAAAAKPTVGPATTPVAAVVSKTGRVTLPTYVAPNAPPADVPGTGITPPGYTAYPQKLVRSVADPPLKGGEVTV